MEYLISLVLVLFSALFSGLNLGFFSLGKDDLKRKFELGDPEAQKVYALRENGNLLLCTLLIGNVAVNSALSIFLGSITSGVVAGFIATFIIVVFGEIIPQAVFSRYALKFGAKLSWLVRIFIFIFYPICRPIAFFLDKILGKEMSTIYSREEIMEMIEDHKESQRSDIDRDEEKIIKGALSFSSKLARDIMTPRSAMFTVSGEEKLSFRIIEKIIHSGHSRIPVYCDNRDNIIGILFTKDLVGLKEGNKKVGELMRKGVLYVNEDEKLDNLMNRFKKTRRHLFIVLNSFGETCGLVTIEDVIEEIIGDEIIDEFDKYEDLQEVARAKNGKQRMDNKK